EVLRQKARETLQRLGYDEPPADTAHGFTIEHGLARHFERLGSTTDWNAMFSSRLPFVSYWYRTSPERLLVLQFNDSQMTPGQVRPTEPPTILSGMTNLTLDSHGRLLELLAIPPQKEDAPSPNPAPPDWDLLLSAAGLDGSQLQPAEPLWTSLAASDA